MSINKAVFLDRDGTINVDRHYIHRVQDFEFLPNAPEALKLLEDSGYLLIIITNQSGIARGYYTVQDYERLNDWMISTLASDYNVHITASYYCPHLPPTSTGAAVPKYRAECSCRKPKTALFERAIQEHSISLEGSYDLFVQAFGQSSNYAVWRGKRKII